LPVDGEDAPQQHDVCNDCFSGAYLQRLVNQSQSYCADGAVSDLTCFHSNVDEFDAPGDSLCLGQGAVLDVAAQKYALDCPPRALDADSSTLQLPLYRLRITGPRTVFQQAVKLETGIPGAHGDSNSNSNSNDSPPRFHLLVKRKGATNLWETLLEILSASMTLDVLRNAHDPSNATLPLFPPIAAADTQTVILDDHADGPYFDLWRLFSPHPPVRFKALLASPASSHAPKTNIILPLAGAGNPLWENDWVDRPNCTLSPTLRAFSRRILTHHHIPPRPAPPAATGPLTLTLLTRRHTRRLLNHTALLAALAPALRPHLPALKIQTLDPAALSFPDQLRRI
ncbi:hypothetical protein BT67DRAFT_338918, partial [Trichocladium antarcticum]